ncbi:hypothetical protein C2S53_012276 [Perilla frutescens var. hirtella]|uniref:WAT1-related protein n=1 Tax=Perilla frutescens var. hirtella TaxID=608512 RepID=A0AAD4P4R6_PERFH|nr:hypothetical protein C2S53_012276 [Perilla frutescens var. hirtella]
MENAAAAVPYLGMVIVQFAQVGLMVAGKVAIANGMTTFTFIFYSNIMASLILLPICVSIHRSGGHPPLVPTFLCGFFVLGFIGFMVQVFGYAGLLLTSASLSTTILNLIPAFTFILAVVFRMEKLQYKSSSTAAKCMGTLVSIVGAVVATLYQGPSLLGTTSPPQQLITLITASSISSPWLIGGFLLTLDSIVSAIFIIAQAVVIRRYPAELILMLFYSCFIAILSAATSLILEKDDLKAWSLNSTMRFIPVIYSGLFGTVFQVTIIIWCVRRKGPVFASIFHPLGVIFSIAAGIIILGETFYLGSLVGAVVVVVGFYAVMWGKVKEAKTTHEEEEHDNDGKRTVPLLQNHTHHRQDIATP